MPQIITKLTTQYHVPYPFSIFINCSSKVVTHYYIFMNSLNYFSQCEKWCLLGFWRTSEARYVLVD